MAPADTPMPRVDHSISSSGIPARDVSRDATAANAAVPRTVPHPTSVIIAEAGSMATAVWQNVLAARIPAALIQVFQLRIMSSYLSGGYATGHKESPQRLSCRPKMLRAKVKHRSENSGSGQILCSRLSSW